MLTKRCNQNGTSAYRVRGCPKNYTKPVIPEFRRGGYRSKIAAAPADGVSALFFNLWHLSRKETLWLKQNRCSFSKSLFFSHLAKGRCPDTLYIGTEGL
jgi:hypothetical protein